MKFAYLVKVEPDANNNKYYRMIENGNGTFTAEFGRIGVERCQKASYDMGKWNTKFNEKLSSKKGYSDYTHLVSEPTIEEKKNKEYLEIKNVSVANIVARLQSMAKKAIEDNYTISSNKVTQKMIDEAQIKLNELINIDSIEIFNKVLVDLFQIIPRKMGKVKDYLAKEKCDLGSIVCREQDLLDVMRGQTIQQLTSNTQEKSKSDDVPLNNCTILESLGLIVEETTQQEKEMIKGMFGNNQHIFVQAWKVVNIRTQKRFDEFIKKEKITDKRLLFHGTRSENVWSIANMGLVLRPKAVITGSMFGKGLYLSNDHDKSRGYTSVSGSRWSNGNSNTGFMLLMDTAYGNPYDVYSFDNKYYDMNYENLQKAKKNAHVLHAHGGTGMLRKDEIVCYLEDQITVKYLIEIK